MKRASHFRYSTVLLDFAPDISREPPTSRAKSLRDLKQSVRRDLEWLLNTRNHSDEIANQLEEVSKSMAVYGLSDFTGTGIKSPGEQKKLVQSLETAIRHFRAASDESARQPRTD